MKSHSPQTRRPCGIPESPDLIPEVKSDAERLGKGGARPTPLPAAQASPPVPSQIWSRSCGHGKPTEPRRGVVAGEVLQGGGALLARWTIAVSETESSSETEFV